MARQVEIPLPLLSDEAYDEIGLDPKGVISDIADAAHWQTLIHACLTVNQDYKNRMGEDFYPDSLLEDVKAYDAAFSRVKTSLVAFRKSEMRVVRNQKEVEDGVHQGRKALRALADEYHSSSNVGG